MFHMFKETKTGKLEYSKGWRGHQNWRLGRGIIRIDMVKNSPELMKDIDQQIKKTQEF